MRTRDRVRRALAAALVATLAATVAVACSNGPARQQRGDLAVATVPPPENPLPTLVGSTVNRLDGETAADALARIDAAYGPIRVARIFSPGLPVSWRYLDDLMGDRPAVVSFRASPRSILSGEHDRALRAWFRDAPTDRDTWWAYFHEPEDDVERGYFRARAFKRAWKHVDTIAERVDNPRLHPTMVLMCWTPQQNSGRDWRDYVPRHGRVEVLAFDCYAKGRGSLSYADPEKLFAAGYRAAKRAGAEWAVSELGAVRDSSDDGTARAAWLTEAAAWAVGRARFLTYFDSDVGGDFRLTDEPSRAAWADVVAASPWAGERVTGVSGG